MRRSGRQREPSRRTCATALVDKTRTRPRVPQNLRAQRTYLRSDGEFKLLFEPPERSKPAGTTPTTEVGSRLWLKVAEGVPVTTLSHRCGLGPLGVAKSRDRKNPCRFTDDLQSG